MVEADSFKFFCFQSITGTKFMCQADIKMREVFIFFLLVPNLWTINYGLVRQNLVILPRS